MSIKIPFITKEQAAMLIAAWTKNQLEIRLAWLSPTYTQWNPKLPWGTDYEALTEQPPSIPTDSTNARLEPWRRWNWVTDGTPNKWLNVPYEYPWNMAAGQYSSPYNLLWTNATAQNPTPSSSFSGIVPLPVTTMDLAVWNPSSYVSRPAVSSAASTIEDGDSTISYLFPDIVEEDYETIVMRTVSCCQPIDVCSTYQIPEIVTRVKGVTYDENGNKTGPILYHPRTGEPYFAPGTVFNWGQMVTRTRSWRYNAHGKYVFKDSRLQPAVCRWNLEPEFYRDDDRFIERRHYQVSFPKVIPRYEYSCNERALVVTLNPYGGYGSDYETWVYTRPSGHLVEFDVNYTDAFKFGSYQKKTPYPCYQKPPRPADRRYWESRNANIQGVEGAELSGPYFFNGLWSDLKPEAYGDGNTRLEVDGYDDAPNTWYSRWRYKPSQHWADGWGIRCESANFYNDPEYRIGKVFQSAGEINSAGAELDPITQDYNSYFWQGMHKELYPMFLPGQYVGTAIKNEEGIPRLPDIPPNEEEDLYEYEERTENYVSNFSHSYIYGAWFTMPVNHYSANDLWKTLCKQNDIPWRPDRPDEVLAALAAINVPGQPNVLQPPVPSAGLLDTTFIFNQNTLVPTDFVHASMAPLPVAVNGFDRENAYVTTSPLGATLDLKPVSSWSGENPDTKLEITLREPLLREDGTPAVPPLRNLRATPSPTVRPPFATLANYPTGWEIHPDHYKTHQARLIGETEMNHRCESIPNWLDTDGGLLYYFTEGLNIYTPYLGDSPGYNYVDLTRTTVFFFMRQTRLPSYHDTHQAINVKVELLFRKKIEKRVFDDAGRSDKTEVTYDVERYQVDLKWPDDQTLDPEFDPKFTQADTGDKGKKQNPSKTPSKWWGVSTIPQYTIYKVTKFGLVKAGVVEDKRDWQAHGPYSETAFSIVTYFETIDYSGYNLIPTWSRPYVNSVYQEGPPPSYTHEVVPNLGYQYGPIKISKTSLELIDVKITDISGYVYRGYGTNGPPGSSA